MSLAIEWQSYSPKHTHTHTHTHTGAHHIHGTHSLLLMHTHQTCTWYKQTHWQTTQTHGTHTVYMHIEYTRTDITLTHTWLHTPITEAIVIWHCMLYTQVCGYDIIFMANDLISLNCWLNWLSLWHNKWCVFMNHSIGLQKGDFIQGRHLGKPIWYNLIVKCVIFIT